MLLGLGLAGGIAGCDRPVAEAGSPADLPAPPPALQYRMTSLPTADVYGVTLAANSLFEVVVDVADGLQPLPEFIVQPGTAAVINAGFFDPANGLTTSYVVQNGQIVADPRQNDRLMQNPSLTPYLPKILNRSEFRRYRCGEAGQELDRYAIARHADPVPPHCTLQDAIGGGPRLLPEMTLEAEGFTDPATGRDAIGSTQQNARSAVGILPNGDVVMVMVAQRPSAPTASGLSLGELAEFLRSLGVVEAMNLDGGSSTSLYYVGNTVFGRVDAQGNAIQRPVKSVLRVREKGNGRMRDDG
ncbi:MAG: hypothetical protein Fur0046_35430 [Cyanobacteria bacterium J069]